MKLKLLETALFFLFHGFTVCGGYGIISKSPLKMKFQSETFVPVSGKEINHRWFHSSFKYVSTAATVCVISGKGRLANAIGGI